MDQLINVLQPFKDFFNTIFTFSPYLALCIGVFAALNKQVFLHTICFIGLFVFVFSKIGNIVPNALEPLNNIFLFLFVGYCGCKVIQFAFNQLNP